MPEKAIFIKCSVCGAVIYSIRPRPKYKDVDIYSLVKVGKDHMIEPVCSDCRYPKKGSCAVVDDIMNLFKMR